MKRLQIKKEQIEMVAGLYDGVNFFYDNDNEEAIMLQDVLDTDLSSLSFNRDTSFIVPVTDRMKQLLPMLEAYSLDNSKLVPRSFLQTLNSDEVKLFRMLGVPNLLFTASFVESVDEPDKLFVLIHVTHPHSEEKSQSKMETVLKTVRSLESDIYIHQVGKKCQKKLQK